MSKKPLVIIPLLILIGGGGYWGYKHYGHQPASTTELTLYGNIDLRQVQLAFNEAGRIETLNAQAGDPVKKGQLLGTLDQRRYQANLASAKATLATRQAALDRLLAGSRPEDIARLQAVVSADKARLKAATLTYERTRRVTDQKLASRQSLDEARANMDAARGQLQANQQSLKLAILGPRKEDIAEARAAVETAKAAVQLAEVAMSDTKLTAPSDGVIRNRILEPGDMASASQPVFALALTDPIWARVYVEEPDLGHIRPGMPATILSDSFPGKAFKGWIGYISPSAEFTPKSVETTRVRSELVYQARVYACNPDGKLRLGMPVTVHVDRNAKPVARGENPCQPNSGQ